MSLLSSILFVLDLLAAFDAANNKLLISKMVEMLISRSVLFWFISYLNDSRYQINWKGLHALFHWGPTGIGSWTFTTFLLH